MYELNKKNDDVFKEIEMDIMKGIEEEKAFNIEELKEVKSKQRNLLLTALQKMLGKILVGLKIEIVVSWRNKVLFTYIIPKN